MDRIVTAILVLVAGVGISDACCKSRAKARTTVVQAPVVVSTPQVPAVQLPMPKVVAPQAQVQERTVTIPQPSTTVTERTYTIPQPPVTYTERTAVAPAVTYTVPAVTYSPLVTYAATELVAVEVAPACARTGLLGRIFGGRHVEKTKTKSVTRY
jgi:hypothetical protein